MRAISAILIEGLLLFVFGYRRRSSWIAFVVITVITQSLLYAYLDYSTTEIMMFFIMIMFEFLVFIAEIIAYILVLKEHRERRATIYALTANIASFLLGGLLMTYRGELWAINLPL